MLRFKQDENGIWQPYRIEAKKDAKTKRSASIEPSLVARIAEDAPTMVQEVVSEKSPTKQTEIDLSAMTVDELTAYAKESGIDLGGAKQRRTIIAAIERHEP